jgi:hypothetical protein
MELGEKVHLLPGASAYRLGTWSLIAFMSSAPLVPLALVIYVATGSSAAWQSPFAWAAFMLGVVLACAGFLLLMASRLKGRRETARGYTTTVGLYRQFRQVDPRSGIVIRRAGDPFLERRPDGFDGRSVRDPALAESTQRGTS